MARVVPEWHELGESVAHAVLGEARADGVVPWPVRLGGVGGSCGAEGGASGRGDSVARVVLEWHEPGESVARAVRRVARTDGVDPWPVRCGMRRERMGRVGRSCGAGTSRASRWLARCWRRRERSESMVREVLEEARARADRVNRWLVHCRSGMSWVSRCLVWCRRWHESGELVARAVLERHEPGESVARAVLEEARAE